MTSPEGADAQLRTWTSQKLDWMMGVAIDPRVPPSAFEVGFVIVQHVNAATGVAFVSDETIQDETNLSRAHVWRARKLLLDREWLRWRRTRTANVYQPLFENLQRFIDFKVMRREARVDRRNERWQRQRDISPTKHRKFRDASSVRHHGTSPAKRHDVSPAMHIHLGENTSSGTPSLRKVEFEEEV